MVRDIDSFIKKQLDEGRDARTIRNYLISKHVDKNLIDKAFDNIFGAKTKSENKTSVEKFVIAGMVLLFAFLIIAGYSVYTNILSQNTVSKISPVVNPSSTNNLGASTNNCELKDSEEKYQCYASKFDNEEYNCYEITNSEEREFCYRSQDFYALSS